jgi:hypothetical protein
VREGRGKAKRYIEIGETIDITTEVKSGLREGDVIYD